MGSPCPSNSTSWQYGSEVGDKILSTGFNELVDAVNKECTRRGISQITNGSASYDVIDTKKLWQTISDKITSFGGFNPPSFVQYDIIYAATVKSLKTTINSAEAACPCNCNYACTCNCNYACTCVCNYCTCNCNYAPCGCNYCTCNCNYCTCNCNYCTCVCNYACTCVCNYACTCVCNYACTCVCNYCTCDCNYCTCDCNYCTCNCNYSCTCNCHYCTCHGVCCWIFLEARYGNGTMNKYVRKYRDEQMNEKNRRGYYKLAEVFVPMMRKSKMFKFFVQSAMCDPMTSYFKYYYTKKGIGWAFKPITKMWIGLYDYLGGDHPFIRENGEVV